MLEQGKHNTAVKNRGRLALYLSLLVFALNVILRSWASGANDLAMDEPFALWWAQQDIPAILQLLSGGNDSLLHYFILHAWIKLFGLGTFAVRFPSVLFSALAAALLFYTGWKFFSQRVAIAVALVFSLSAMQMQFAHEARPYALFVMLSAWNLFIVLSILRTPEKKSHYLWLFINNLLLVYTHYFAWILIAMQVLVLLASSGRRQRWKPLLIVTALLLVCYLPNVAILLDRLQASAGGTWVRKPEWSELYGNINRFLNSRWVSLTIIGAAFIGILMVVIRKKIRELITNLKKNKSWQVIALSFLLPWCGMFAVSFVMPIFLDRYLLFTTPALYLALVAAFELLPIHKTVKTILMMIPALCMLLFFEISPSNHRNIKEVVAKVQSMRQPGDAVLISPDYAILEFSYHYNINAFADYAHTREQLQQQRIYALNSLQQLPASITDSSSSLIYLDCGSAFVYGTDIVGEELKKKDTLIEECSIPAIYTISRFVH